MKRLLAVLTLATILGALAPSSVSASVQPTDMTICNAAASRSWIWPHELPQGWGAVGTELRPGWCRTYHNNTGQLRVYNGGQSYKYGTSGQGYGACKNGPWDSDPPNSANGTTQDYNDWVHDNCVN